MKNVHEKFKRKFTDFKTLREAISFMVLPFNDSINFELFLFCLIEDESIKVEEIMTKLRSDTFFKL